MQQIFDYAGKRSVLLCFNKLNQVLELAVDEELKAIVDVSKIFNFQESLFMPSA